VGHKLTNFYCLTKWRPCSWRKEVKIAKKKLVIKVKVISALVNMVDVHVTIQSKATKKQVFKDQELIKNKTTPN
jgi:hypothetical protein